MSTLPKLSARAAKLDHLLSQSPPPVLRGGDVDFGQMLLAGVPLERIRALTLELQERAEATPDDLDAITMRLLLNDYKSAVADLRAFTNSVDGRLLAAGEDLHRTRKLVHREEEMIVKRAAAATNSG